MVPQGSLQSQIENFNELSYESFSNKILNVGDKQNQLGSKFQNNMSAINLPIQYFFEPYYEIYAKAKFLRIVNEKISIDLKKILNDQTFRKKESPNICVQDICFMVEIIISSYHRVLIRYLRESLNRFQNIFQFSTQEWKKFCRSLSFQNLKSFIDLISEGALVWEKKILQLVNSRGICRKCKELVNHLAEELKKSIPLYKFSKLYNKTMFRVMCLFDQAVKANNELIRSATCIAYSLTLISNDSKEERRKKFSHFYRFLRKEEKKKQGDIFDFSIYYKFIEESQCERLNEHYKVLVQEYKKADGKR